MSLYLCAFVKDGAVQTSKALASNRRCILSSIMGFFLANATWCKLQMANVTFGGSFLLSLIHRLRAIPYSSLLVHKPLT